MFRRLHKRLCFRVANFAVLISALFSFVLPPSISYAQVGTILNLPQPGVMVDTSPLFVPALIKGITIHPENPLMFDFIIDTGNVQFDGSQAPEDWVRAETKKLAKYFLASLTIPEDDLWVNLSPYEEDRTVPEAFGQTEMGRDLLAQDYLLKQITASLIYPEKEVGKDFWARIYKKAQEQYGTTEIPVNTFNKVWVVPDQAGVLEKDNTAFIVKAHLKVMLEEDYVALSHQKDSAESPAPAGDVLSSQLTAQSPEAAALQTNALGSQIVRDIVIPELEREVNEGKNFAQLRQVFYSLILAKWFKNNLKDSLVNQIYADQNKTAGVVYESSVIASSEGEALPAGRQESQTSTDGIASASPRNDVEAIYQQYLAAYKKGVFNFIKEDYDQTLQETIPRKYFSGGVVGKFPVSVQQAGNLDNAQLAAIQPALEATGLNYKATVGLNQLRSDAAMLDEGESEGQRTNMAWYDNVAKRVVESLKPTQVWLDDPRAQGAQETDRRIRAWLSRMSGGEHISSIGLSDRNTPNVARRLQVVETELGYSMELKPEVKARINEPRSDSAMMAENELKAAKLIFQNVKSEPTVVRDSLIILTRVSDLRGIQDEALDLVNNKILPEFPNMTAQVIGGGKENYIAVETKNMASDALGVRDNTLKVAESLRQFILTKFPGIDAAMLAVGKSLTALEMRNLGEVVREGDNASSSFHTQIGGRHVSGQMLDVQSQDKQKHYVLRLEVYGPNLVRTFYLGQRVETAQQRMIQLIEQIEDGEYRSSEGFDTFVNAVQRNLSKASPVDVEWSSNFEPTPAPQREGIDAAMLSENARPVVKVLFADAPEGKETVAEVQKALEEIKLTNPGAVIEIVQDTRADKKDPQQLRRLIEQEKPAIVMVRSNTNAFGKKEKTPGFDHQEFIRNAAQNGVRAIVRMGAGYDNIDDAYAAQQEISVLRTHGNARSVADLTLALISSLANMDGFPIQDSPQTSGVDGVIAWSDISATSWSEYAGLIQGSTKWQKGISESDKEAAVAGLNARLNLTDDPVVRLARVLNGKTIGILGFGAIAHEVIRKLNDIKEKFGIDFKIIASTRSFGGGERQQESLQTAAELGITPVDREALLSQSDILSIHIMEADGVQLTPEELEAHSNIKALINTSRSGLIPDVAARTFVERGGALLGDFDMTGEYFNLMQQHPERTILLPHIGASTEDAADNVEVNTIMAVSEVTKRLLGKPWDKLGLDIVNNIDPRPVTDAAMLSVGAREFKNHMSALDREITPLLSMMMTGLQSGNPVTGYPEYSSVIYPLNVSLEGRNIRIIDGILSEMPDGFKFEWLAQKNYDGRGQLWTVDQNVKALGVKLSADADRQVLLDRLKEMYEEITQGATAADKIDFMQRAVRVFDSGDIGRDIQRRGGEIVLHYSDFRDRAGNPASADDQAKWGPLAQEIVQALVRDLQKEKNQFDVISTKEAQGVISIVLTSPSPTEGLYDKFLRDVKNWMNERMARIPDAAMLGGEKDRYLGDLERKKSYSEPFLRSEKKWLLREIEDAEVQLRGLREFQRQTIDQRASQEGAPALRLLDENDEAINQVEAWTTRLKKLEPYANTDAAMLTAEGEDKTGDEPVEIEQTQISVEDNRPAGEFPEVQNQSASKDQAMLNPGGIDLSKEMDFNIQKENGGVQITFDPAQIERIRELGVEGFDPIVIQVVPLQSVWMLLGLEPPRREEELAALTT